MPLYEMLCISAHVSKYTYIRELVRQTAMHVMDSGGVVRKIDSWGMKTLPQRMKRNGPLQSFGDYWTLYFDASPGTVRSLNRIMRRDPRVIRWTVLKIADNLEALAKQGQKLQVPDKIRTPVSSIVD